MGDISLKYRDIWTLKEHGWLNDEVMNAYINLLSLRCPDVLLLNTFFIEILKQKYPSIPLDKVHRILRRRGVDSIFDRQKVVIPVNIDNRHWVCYCVDHGREVVTYYDSLNLPEAGAGDVLLRYLHLEIEGMGLAGKPTYRRVRGDCAVQRSHHDCGVFALMNIRNCLLTSQVEVDQELMGRIRRMITMELKQGRIL